MFVAVAVSAAVIGSPRKATRAFFHCEAPQSANEVHAKFAQIAAYAARVSMVFFIVSFNS